MPRRSWPALLALLLVPVVGLGSGGAVGADPRSWLAGLVVAALVGLAVGPVDARAARVGVAALGVAAALGVGLVPVGRGVLEAIAPAVADARPHDATWTLSLRPEATRLALATWAVVAGVAVAAAALVHDRRVWARGLAWATVAWAAFGVAHAASGTHALLGQIPARSADGPWLAPLVNPNHHVAVLLAGAPFVAAEVLRRPRSWAVLPLGATLAWTVAAPVVVRSIGGLLALGVLALAAIAATSLPLRARAALGAGLAALGVGGAATVLRLQPEWWALSGGPRVTQWFDTVRLLAAAPVTGVGAGAYRAAFAPFRTSPQFQVVDHVHADPLEWAAELGLVGVLVIVASTALLPRASGPGVRPWSLSLLGLGVAAAVDFPLHLPGVAVLAAILVAGRQAGDTPTRTLPGAAFVALAAVEVIALVGLRDRAAADEAVAAVRVEQPTSAGIEAAAAAAPWASEPVVARLAATWDPAAADAAGRRFADDGAAQLRLGALAAKAKDLGRARAFVDRSLARDPNDPRPWRLLSALRLAEGDRRGAAEASAAALVHWPGDAVGDAEAFDAAYALLPVGLWWLEALEPAHARWSIRLAERMVKDGQPEVAELACVQAAELRPLVFAHHGVCAEALLALGRQDEALAYLKAWVEDEPDAFAAWVTAARLAAKVDDPSARGLWQRGLLEAWVRAPASPAVCALLTGDLQRACAEEADQLQPGTCALAEVAVRGKGTKGAAWLASQRAFREHAGDPALWSACR